MSVKTVERFIKKGDYDEAKYQVVSLMPVMKLIYQSKIAELTGHFNEAKQLANSAIKLAKSSEEKLAAAITSAYANWRLFEFDEAFQVLQSVTPELEDTVLELNPWRGTYYNIEGLIHWKMNNLKDAFTSFEKALIIREDIGDNYPLSYTLNNLGNTYLSYKDYEKAEKYFTQAKDIRLLLQYDPSLAASANSFGRLLDAIGQYNRAKGYYDESLELWQKVGNEQFIGKSYRFLAINAYHRRNDGEALEYFGLSDQQFSNLGNKTDMKTNQELKAKYLKKRKD